MRELSVVLAALYLRGGIRPVELRRAAWPEVLRLLRRSGCEAVNASEVLREGGFWGESLVLDHPGIIGWAENLVDDGSVLSAVDPEYPVRWVRVMGASAPPVLWKVGVVPALPCVSVVGSRVIPPEIARFCRDVATETCRLGFGVVSGRAEGCDRAAARGSTNGAMVEILPHGIDLARDPVGCFLSVCAPNEPFSGPSAMERNALIYAASSHTVIGHARFKEGGTWTGAVSAVRSRLSTLVVRRSDDVAMRSLVALGGGWIEDPADLSRALKSSSPQRQLFESAI